MNDPLSKQPAQTPDVTAPADAPSGILTVVSTKLRIMRLKAKGYTISLTNWATGVWDHAHDGQDDVNGNHMSLREIWNFIVLPIFNLVLGIFLFRIWRSQNIAIPKMEDQGSHLGTFNMTPGVFSPTASYGGDGWPPMHHVPINDTYGILKGLI